SSDRSPQRSTCLTCLRISSTWAPKLCMVALVMRMHRPRMLLLTAPPWDVYQYLHSSSRWPRSGASEETQSQEETVARTSKKEEALQAALHIIELDGVQALTYEALAEATGMSKSGLIYHFPSRHEMLIDIHAWSAQRWEDELVSIAGKPASELDTKQRLRA